MKQYEVDRQGKLLRIDLEKIGSYTLRQRRFNENCLMQGTSKALETISLYNKRREY